jgi:hypothetical protein
MAIISLPAESVRRAKPNFLCLSADVANLSKSVEAGQTAYVTDTFTTYIFNGTTWVAWYQAVKVIA